MEINQSTPSPKPLPGKILVDIKTADVNPVDSKVGMFKGHMQQMMHPVSINFDVFIHV